MADFLQTLGDIPADRVRWNPLPGTATEADAVQLHESQCYCELVDGTLVEKPMSAPEGFMGMLFGYFLNGHVVPRRLGAVIGADAQFRMIEGNLRLPDVSFTRRERIPNPIPQMGGWCPDLCVEIISPSNTSAEFAPKRREYFASGCQLVWEIDPRARTAIVYRSANDTGESVDRLEGGTVLPGFALPLATLFAEFDAGTNDIA